MLLRGTLNAASKCQSKIQHGSENAGNKSQQESAYKSVPHSRAFLLEGGLSALSCESAQRDPEDNDQHAEEDKFLRFAGS